MMNIFYELNSDNLSFSAEETGYRYWAQYDLMNPGREHHHLAMLHSQRVWIEDESGIRFFKNRNYGNIDVDLKEFVFIKLKCRTL